MLAILVLVTSWHYSKIRSLIPQVRNLAVASSYIKAGAVRKLPVKRQGGKLIYKERLKEWLDRVYEPGERDISCRELLDQLPAYIDTVVQGQHGNGKFSELDQHLADCPDCAEIYAELVTLAELEADGRLPEAEELIAELASEQTTIPTL